uniref:NADH dehydrogenase subunit 2 n=1 Tax=Clavinema parasiluri TaxID=332280 RepID=A0A9F2HGY0_9BILA|nr:NADH dehydrogenase subunit 2 [Clavinema parasiluri]WAX01697.1 NADH dehydrogenase subunit 2 [Clavinema parasiluri]
MFYLFGFMFVLMFFINFVVNNVLVWWSVFVISVFIFIWMCKFYGSLVGMVNYFVVQEGAGLLFLFFSGSVVQFFSLMVKSGLSPFHFWIFSVGLDLKSYMMMWFLVVQKLPFIPVILGVFDFCYFLILILGLLVCHFQYLVLNSDSSMLMISSTESFGWLVLILCWSYYSFILMVCVYMLMMVVVVGVLGGLGLSGNLGWDSVIVFMNFPLGLVFILKYYVISLVSCCSFVILILFFSVVMAYMCLMFWMISVSMFGSGVWLSKVLGFLVFFMVFLLVI